MLTSASKISSNQDGFETAKLKLQLMSKDVVASELDFWLQYGITKEVLERYHVSSIEAFHGISKEGKEYELNSTEQEPIFGYHGRRHTKLYLPNSRLRFLYTGEITESYVFGIEQLPVSGDILFITGGEKDVLSLFSHGFDAI